MKLNYVLGRSGRGKTEYILKQIKTLLDEDNLCRILVIVPEQATFRMERDLIEQCDLPGLFNLSVVSFDRLVHEILNACGGRTLSPLDFIGKTMVVRALLDAHRDDLTVFGKSASMPGFEIKMTEMLTELKRQDISLDDLAQAEAMKLPPITRQKLTDIALLYQSYNEKLAGEHMDSEDIISLAIEKADTHNYFNGAHVFVDGFDLLTHQMLRLLTLAISQSVCATISFRKNGGDARDNMVFAPEEKQYIRIDEAAKDLGIRPTEIVLSSNHISDTKYASTELLHLEQNLFAYPFSPYFGAPKDIMLSSQDSQALEVKDACSKIIDLLGEGYRFRDIAICIGDMDTYRETLNFHLSENQIPFFMDAKTKLMDTAFAEFLISLLDFILYKDTADFIVHIKSGFLDILPDQLYAVENYIRHYQLKGYMLNYGFKHAEAKTEKARKTLTAPIFELMRSLKSAKTAESYGEDILTYLKVCHVDENVKRFAKRLEDAGDLNGALVFSQVFEKIVEIINQACIMFKDQPISFDSFVSAIKAGLEAVEIAIIPPSTDNVLVGDFSRTAFPPVKALFVLGLNDGKIPASLDASAILTDTEKQALEDQGLRAGYRDRFFEERIRIYSVFSTSTEKLLLSYPNSADKDAAKPSVLVGRIQKLFPNLKTGRYIPREQILPNLAKESLFRDLSLSLNQKMEGLAISTQWRDVYEHFQKDKDWQPRIQRMASRLKKTDKNETIASNFAGQLYQPLTASVTRAEKYYACPMQYFLHYGIKPTKEDFFEETPLEMGNFLHACLHEFVKSVKKSGLEWGALSDAQISDTAERVLDSVKKTHNQGIFLDKRFSAIFARLRLDFLSAVRTIRDQLSNTDVSVNASELSLQGADYLNFKMDNGAVLALTCKVDRVDVLDNGAAKIVRIVDYKLSGKSAGLKDVYFGLNIQLLVYLKFVLEYFKAKGDAVIIGGAFYYDLSLPIIENTSQENLLKEKRMNGYLIDNADINEKMSKLDDGAFVATAGRVKKDGSLYKSTKTVLTAEQFDTLFDYCEGLIKQAFVQILSGEVTPLPYKDGQEVACKNCDYGSICLFDEDLDAYRVLEDKTIKDFERKE